MPKAGDHFIVELKPSHVDWEIIDIQIHGNQLTERGIFPFRCLKPAV